MLNETEDEDFSFPSRAHYRRERGECIPGCFFADEPPLEVLAEEDFQLSPEANIRVRTSLYDTLTTGQTRILAVYPGKSQSPLVTELKTVRQDDHYTPHGHKTANHTEYEALSYCWGDPTPCRRLECNGCHLSIPRETFRALRGLRSETTVVHIWVDAICINQDDWKEKAIQVPRILGIYQKAKRICVWLGDMVEYGRRLSFLGGKLLSEWDKKQYAGEGTNRNSKLDNDAAKLQICKAHADAANTGLQHILEHPWFTRVWVKQEIWAAQHVEMFCEGSMFTWQAIEIMHHAFKVDGKADTIVRALNSGMEWYFQGLNRVFHGLVVGNRTLHLQVREKDKPNPLLVDDEANFCDIVNVLRRVSSSKCSLRHDHIYGLLGMSSTRVRVEGDHVDASDNVLTVSYDKPSQEVFSDVARYVIKRDACLNILFLDQLIDTNNTVIIGGHARSSWYPDWAHRIGSLDWLWKYIKPEDMISSFYIPPDTDKPEILKVRGFSLGFVNSVKSYDIAQPEYMYTTVDKSRTVYTMIGWDEFFMTPATDTFLDQPNHISKGDQNQLLRFNIGSEIATISCFAPRYVKPGDQIFVAKGSCMPLILHPTSDDPGSIDFQYIGPAVLSVPKDGTEKNVLERGQGYRREIHQSLRQQLDSEDGEMKLTTINLV